MSFAWNTTVESPQGPRPIQDYAVGEPVMAASADGKGGWAWAPRIIEFSSGTGPDGRQPAMIYLRFGEEGELIVTMDQPLLIAGGKLQRANRLEPGRDSLVGAGGDLLPVQVIEVGAFEGGIHHIATTIADGADWDGSLDGHLLNSAGVISGDFVLQIRQGDPRMARYLPDEKDAPPIGTRDWQAGARDVA